MISTREAVQELKNLKRELEAEQMFLFGSVARQEQHELSDVDTLIVLKTTKRFHERIGDVLDRYSGKLPLQPIVYTPDEFITMKKSPAIQHMLKSSVEI